MIAEKIPLSPSLLENDKNFIVSTLMVTDDGDVRTHNDAEAVTVAAVAERRRRRWRQQQQQQQQ